MIAYFATLRYARARGHNATYAVLTGKEIPAKFFCEGVDALTKAGVTKARQNRGQAAKPRKTQNRKTKPGSGLASCLIITLALRKQNRGQALPLA